MKAESCVFCGEIIPEGCQVCPVCEQRITQNTDAIKFFKTQIKRSRINLQAALERNDVRAVANINRKISIFEYVIEVLNRNK